eukprot:TRINITY_DN8169_c0_g1_i1.p1 TRINITY_DN8169_c0_g1~~TRINITY_DN8169_c0_g1_i1.p1  ORF type:complete len:156 (-),score=26.76 TRINITY_DN8169_c0_g1_i1:169-636(-)
MPSLVGSEMCIRDRFYTVATSVPLKDLLADALILAQREGFDVFNALDIMENGSFLKELKFNPGDGCLHYYLYNWRVSKKELEPKDIGTVLFQKKQIRSSINSSIKNQSNHKIQRIIKTSIMLVFVCLIVLLFLSQQIRSSVSRPSSISRIPIVSF